MRLRKKITFRLYAGNIGKIFTARAQFEFIEGEIKVKIVPPQQSVTV